MDVSCGCYHIPPSCGSYELIHIRRKMLQVPFHRFIERCSTMEELKCVHAQILTRGLFQETFIVGKLVAFCSLSDVGDLGYAHAVFDRVPEPNRFMWNSLIRGYSNSASPREALFLQRWMLCAGALPNDFTLPFVLKSCAFESAFRETQEVHTLIFKLGFRSQVFMQNALLHAYAACRTISFARKVFDDIPYPNIVSWNSMIDGYSQLGKCKEAFHLFRSMRYLSLEPDGFTFTSLLSVCSQTGCLRFGRLVHHFIEISGGMMDVIVGNALVDMYAKCGELSSAEASFGRMPKRNVITWTSMVSAYARQGLHDLARCCFDRMPERNIVSWNSMISSYVQYGKCREAFILYTEMQASNVEPDEMTLTSILSVCGQVGDLITGKNIHHYILQNSMHSSVSLMNSLVDLYGKCGLVATASCIFGRMPDKNLVSWNVMIGAFAMHGRACDAIKLFTSMVAEGITPDGITFVAVLSACGHGGLLEEGLYYFEAMYQTYNIQPEIEHYACVVDLLGRRGELEKAVHMIAKMPMRPDIVIWGVLLGACRIHGNVRIGKLVMKQLLELHPCDGGLYVLTSNLYCEANRWGDGKKMWKFMIDKGITKARAASLIEIGGEIHEFMVEDKGQKISTDIYSTLDQLTDHLRSLEASSVII